MTLVLTRRKAEGVVFIIAGGDRIRVAVQRVKRDGSVRLAIDVGPQHVVLRDELLDTYERGELAPAPQGYTADGRPTQTIAPLLAIGPDSTDLTAPARAAACLHPSPSGRGQGEGSHPDASSSTLSPCGRGQGEGSSPLHPSPSGGGRGQGEGSSSFAQSTTTPREGAAPGPPAVRHAAPRDPDQAAPSQGA